jgi:hypothetical protein
VYLLVYEVVAKSVEVTVVVGKPGAAGEALIGLVYRVYW